MSDQVPITPQPAQSSPPAVQKFIPPVPANQPFVFPGEDAMINDQLAAIDGFNPLGASPGMIAIAKTAAKAMVALLPTEARGCSVTIESLSRGGGPTASLHLQFIVTPKIFKKV